MLHLPSLARDAVWGAIERSHGVAVYDADGSVLQANPRLLAWLGRPAEAVLGQHFDAVRATGGLPWHEIADGAEHEQHHQRHAGVADAVIYLRSTYVPVLDAAGLLSHVIQVATDTTAAVEREAATSLVLDAVKDTHAVLTYDADGLVLDANETFLSVMGYRLDEIVGRHHRIFVDPAAAAGAEPARLWKDLSAGTIQAGQVRHLADDRHELWLQTVDFPIVGPDGELRSSIKLADVIARERLRHHDLQGLIFAIHKSHCVISFDLQGTILSINENFCKALGYCESELLGRNHRVLVTPEQAQSEEYRQFWACLRSGQFTSGLYRRVGKNGRVVWIQSSYNPILDADGKPVRIVKVASDVTANIELAEAFEQARYQTEHDPGTGLPNRIRLHRFLDAALSVPERQLTVLYLDLDYFKPVNDRYGHEAGDVVLRQVADRMRQLLDAAQIGARIGGDEFIVAAPDLSHADAESLCARLIATLSDPIPLRTGTVRVGVSIGVATTADAATADELLRCADVAMYRSKQRGRCTWSFFADAREDKVGAPSALVDEIRSSLAAGDFYLDYQPRFDAQARTIVGVEALLRWTHPTRGLVLPSAFLADAERSLTIVPLGEWVLREAAAAAAAWPGLVVTVNVSPAQLHASAFVGGVAAVLRETGLEPSRLSLELVGFTLSDDEVRLREVLLGLRKLGVRVALDDVSTGSATLGALRTLPFDAFTIDYQALQRDTDRRDGAHGLLRAMLAFAGVFGLTVTLKSVETEDELLSRLDDPAMQVQGNALAGPMPPAGIATLLQPQGPPVRSAEPALG